MADSAKMAVRARWIFPHGSGPLENGTLVYDRETEIVERISAEVVPSAIDLGNVAIIPGLVNAHCHLEFSHLTVPIAPPEPFTQWIRNVIAARMQPTPTVPARIARGIDEVVSAGTTLLGEIATVEDSARLLADAKVGGVVFRELIGLTDERVAAQREILRAVSPSLESPGLIRAFSPHAPYSVRSDLLEETIATARDRQLPICLHLAEQPAERELLAGGEGPFRAFLEQLGLYVRADWCEERTILDLLKSLSRAPRVLIVHGNDLRGEELVSLAESPWMSVVYCPRTHAYFGHPPHPWKDLMERGITVALGTDGRSSNPDLELWREVQFLSRNHPDVPPARLLELATIAGVRALGLGESNGLREGEPLRATILEQLPAGESDPWKGIVSAKVRGARFAVGPL